MPDSSVGEATAPAAVSVALFAADSSNATASLAGLETPSMGSPVALGAPSMGSLGGLEVSASASTGSPTGLDAGAVRSKMCAQPRQLKKKRCSDAHVQRGWRQEQVREGGVWRACFVKERVVER